MASGERMSIDEYRQLIRTGASPVERVAAGKRARRAADVMDLGTSEASVASVLEDYFNLKGYMWFHDQDAKRNRAGLPDYVAVHPCGAGPFWIEAKSETGALRPAQQVWRSALLLSASHYWVARPSNVADVIAEMDEELAAARQASSDS